jgi:CheY-like chemotaxis protein
MTAIAKSTDDPEKTAYALDRIEEASEHLLGVINDILDMSKIEAEKLELSLIDFNFERMFQKVKTVIGPRIEEKQLDFIITIDEDIPKTLVSDDQRLTQVIINLLSNAVKFTDENGSVNLDAHLLGVEGDVYEIQVEVSDSGIGMTEDQIGRLFGSFEQAESGTARKYGGTGLGLAISKSIIDMLGGKIWVTSKIGEGSQFFFTFKAQAAAETQGEDQSSAEAEDALKAAADADDPALSLNGKKGLLAEDIDINREIVLALLEPHGIELDVAVNGLEALGKFEAAPLDYDFVLMDCMMPEMDGYEATRRIRALPILYAQQVPIIAMTANVFKEDIEKCLAAGMNDHVGKPIDLGRLLGALQRNIYGSK